MDLVIPFQREHQIFCEMDEHSLEPSPVELHERNHGPQDGSEQHTEIGHLSSDDLSYELENFSDEFWLSELYPEQLERAAPYLWCLSTQSKSNITSLHHQIIKGRSITITESPRLHLLWEKRRIFIKPIPLPLLSHGFWVRLKRLSLEKHSFRVLQLAALGFIRTYFYLIKHPSDLRIAQEAHLLPHNMKWNQFRRWRSDLGDIMDTDVLSRYCYGELRLARLNLYAPLLFGTLTYEPVYWEYSEYFSRFFAPCLFIFGVLSTSLSALQLSLAADQLAPTKWKWQWDFSRIFGLSVFSINILVLLIISVVYTWFIADEWLFAFRARYQRRRISA